MEILKITTDDLLQAAQIEESGMLDRKERSRETWRQVAINEAAMAVIAVNFPGLKNIEFLDRSNYTIWKSQILSSVRANGLEDLFDRSKICPDLFLPDETKNSSIEAQVNPVFTTWKRKDQLLLSSPPSAWKFLALCWQYLLDHITCS